MISRIKSFFKFGKIKIAIELILMALYMLDRYLADPRARRVIYRARHLLQTIGSKFFGIDHIEPVDDEDCITKLDEICDKCEQIEREI